MEELISRGDFKRAINIEKIKSEKFTDFLMDFLKLNTINALYKDLYTEKVDDFIDNTLLKLGVDYHVSNHDLEKIPKDGPFIVVCNHPYGGIDGLILLRILFNLRPDFKLMANYLLTQVEPIHAHILPVNPFKPNISKTSSFIGLRQTHNYLKKGGAIGVFPSGEVSTFHKRLITDGIWDESTIRFIKQAKVPVIPIYFSGNNSLLFHLLGFINPILRTIKLPSELLNKKNKTVEVRIGKPISVREQKEIENTDLFGRFLRAKTYALANDLEVKRFFKRHIGKRKSTPKPLAEPIEQAIIQAEIEQLTPQHEILQSGVYKVFCVESTLIPNAMKEIGRLRELTYRAVGEGTNCSRDIDEFDLYFHQLIIYDTEAKCIVGGYRIGKGADIMHRYGIQGFYINQLFKLKTRFFENLKESLELGRSYIVPEYQKKPMPLFLLWKGILAFLLKHPEYRYLIGPVSISNHFSGFSRRLLIAFLKTHYYNHEMAELVKPRKAFKIKQKRPEEEVLLEASSEDLNKLDRIIQDIEPLGMSMPVLFKKYLKQNAKVIGFNIDPLFSDALDGLMFLDIYDVPERTIHQLMGEMQDKSLNKALSDRKIVA